MVQLAYLLPVMNTSVDVSMDMLEITAKKVRANYHIRKVLLNIIFQKYCNSLNNQSTLNAAGYNDIRCWLFNLQYMYGFVRQKFEDCKTTKHFQHAVT